MLRANRQFFMTQAEVRSTMHTIGGQALTEAKGIVGQEI